MRDFTTNTRLSLSVIPRPVKALGEDTGCDMTPGRCRCLACESTRCGRAAPESCRPSRLAHGFRARHHRYPRVDRFARCRAELPPKRRSIVAPSPASNTSPPRLDRYIRSGHRILEAALEHFAQNERAVTGCTPTAYRRSRRARLGRWSLRATASSASLTLVPVSVGSSAHRPKSPANSWATRAASAASPSATASTFTPASGTSPQETRE